MSFLTVEFALKILELCRLATLAPTREIYDALIRDVATLTHLAGVSS